MGTIVHDTLEVFYKPLEDGFLSNEHLRKMQLKIDEEVRKQFIKSFKDGDFSKGKNLIIFEVAKRFISNFINFELSEIKKGNPIKYLKKQLLMSFQRVKSKVSSMKERRS